MKIDCRGHLVPVSRIEEDWKTHYKTWAKIAKEVINRESDFLKDMYTRPFSSYMSCEYCGERIEFNIEDNGDTLTALTECSYKKGFQPIKVNMEVVKEFTNMLQNPFRSSCLSTGS
jgi:hypothetical protein